MGVRLHSLCMAWWVEEDFLGGFQNFLVKIEGGLKFCRTRGGAQIYLAMINLDDLGETEKLTRLRTTSRSNAGLPHM